MEARSKTMFKPTIALVALAGAAYAAWSAAPSLGLELATVRAGSFAPASPVPRDRAGEATAPEVGAEPTDACDGVEAPGGMVCIPGGPAVIGSDAAAAASPRHEVYVSRFFIDAHEVTNAEYRECIAAGFCSRPRKRLPASYAPYLADELPATPITWFMARKYCVWAGKRLPTEAEWEKAARGGTEAREYPWGNEPPSCDRAHYKGCKPSMTRPVGSLPPGAYGVYDMAGNGYEWVNDWASECYDGCKDACGDECRGEDPQGLCSGAPWCKGHKDRLLKGGSWYWPEDQMRGSYRRAEFPSSGLHRLSFRCATSLPILTRAPYWHKQEREPPPPLEPPSEEELAVFTDVRDDANVMKITICDRVGKATKECRDPMTYYKSNERHRGVFGPYIENLGGGYVGLAADQAYDFISIAKSEWAWLFDYDPNVVRIHQAIRAVVLNTKTPHEFAESFRIRTLRRTRQWVRNSLADRPEEIHPTIKTLETYRGLLLYHFRVSQEKLPRKFPRFGWLAYQENFDYIRTMYQQGRILTRKGNLLTDVTLPDIAESARKLGVPIRVYYESNAPDQWELSQQYRDNVAGFPFDERSVILRTLHGERFKTEVKWLYVVHGGLHAKRTLRLNHTKYLSHLNSDSQGTEISYVRVIGLPQATGPGVTLSRR